MISGRMETPPASASLPRVVIVGAGFGGLAAARALRRAPARVTVVDRRNHHLFQPLLYQVATAALSPGDIAYPIRAVLRRNRNASVLLAEAVSIDAAARRVLLADGVVPYDFLVLATGSTHSYFGHDEWATRAPGLKDFDDALEIRRRILLAFERAERERDPDRRRALLSFVIVGGGPTGVELAGAIAEISRHVIAADFRAIDPREARILLVEGGPRLLPAYDARLGEKARRQLAALGVQVVRGAPVTRIDAETVEFGDERVAAATVLWAAGVASSPLGRTLGTPLDRQGRVLVDPDLSAPGHPEIFVVGDLAVPREGPPLPGIAPVAIQQGRAAAKNIRRDLAGRPRRPFHYRDKGTMAVIGRSAAVAEIGGWRLSGFPAWLVWCFVHILYLIGFRNRFVVLFEWAWAYATYQRGARLITGRLDRAGGAG